MTIFDWKVLLKPMNKLDSITTETIELMRMKHKDDLLKELEDTRQRRDLRELAKLTRCM